MQAGVMYNISHINIQQQGSESSGDHRNQGESVFILPSSADTSSPPISASDLHLASSSHTDPVPPSLEGTMLTLRVADQPRSLLSSSSSTSNSSSSSSSSSDASVANAAVDEEENENA